MAKRAIVAAVQLTCTNDKVANFEKTSTLIKQCASRGATMVFLPECADYVAQDPSETISLAEEINGNFVTQMKNLAKSTGVWISFGMHRKDKTKSSDEKPFNSHILLDSFGRLRACYDKIHLFHSPLANCSESNSISGGSELVPPVDTPVGKLGLAICFDLRFPEIALRLASKAANVIAFPSAFHPTTGAAHWEVLLRARAIENQVYVIGAAQAGKHNENRSSYGHTMV